MHIYFSGIGGAAIGPLALIASQAGFTVSGSDQQNSQYIDYLRSKGLTIQVGQDRAQIAAVHASQPIDWLVHSSALTIDNPELQFAHEQGIKTSKRDEFISLILEQKQLKMLAVAGTHGKTTTTAMLIWLLTRLEMPLSYSVGGKLSFGDMGHYQPGSQYFVYEADEFDRNFLAFEPYISLVTGVSWDHHEIFPTREDYQQAFREFISQSRHTTLWQEDYDYLELQPNNHYAVLDSADPHINQLQLMGRYNCLDAWLVIQAVQELTHTPLARLVDIMNDFPGVKRRMEPIIPGLYSDYAHTPEKIRGAMSVATAIASAHDQAVVVIYEPLTNRRQHFMIDDYGDCFQGASQVYWLPSYLAREQPGQRIITPAELISHLADPSLARPAERDKQLKKAIQSHLDKGDMVVAMAGGGGDSLDEWLRAEFA